MTEDPKQLPLEGPFSQPENAPESTEGESAQSGAGVAKNTAPPFPGVNPEHMKKAAEGRRIYPDPGN